MQVRETNGKAGHLEPAKALVDVKVLEILADNEVVCIELREAGWMRNLQRSWPTMRLCT